MVVKKVNREEPKGQETCNKKNKCYWGMTIQKHGSLGYCCGFLYLNTGLKPCNRGRIGQDCPQYRPREKRKNGKIIH